MHFILRVGCVCMGTLTRVELNNMSCGAVRGGGARNDCSSPHGCRRLRGIDKTRMDIKKAEVIIKNSIPIYQYASKSIPNSTPIKL
jgi:hypothetical protein